ncbi:MAG: hypothetical protein KC448_01655 [Yoonia sp.]|nr:hypothetical protein [Yoonia sp.]
MQYRPHRYRTEFPTTMKTPFGPSEAVINDVNETGALMKTSAPLARGHKIEFTFLNNKVTGIVQWAADGRCGVTFRPHLTITQVDSLRYKQSGHRSMRHRSTSYVEMR